MEEFDLGEIILDEELEIGDIELDIIKVYPELENLEVTPTLEEQILKPSKYGFDEVKVKAIETEDLEIIPTTENREYEGLFNKVTVAGALDTSDATAKSGDIVEGKTAYVNGEKVVGTLADKGYNAKFEKYGPTFRFPYCITKLEPVDLSGVKTADYCFSNLEYLRSVIVSNGDSLTKMQGFAYQCDLLEDIIFENVDTSKVTTFKNAFAYCYALVNPPEIDASSATTLECCYRECKKLANINIKNTSNVKNFSYAFQKCESLLISVQVDTSGATDLSFMYSGCINLQEITQMITSNNTTLYGFALGCTNLITIAQLDASKCVNVSGFLGSSSSPCPNVENLGGLVNLGKAYTQKTANYYAYKLDVSTSTKLTYESLINQFNELYDLNLSYDVENGGTLYTQSFVVGTENLAKLEATEEGLQAIALANLYGWNIS